MADVRSMLRGERNSRKVKHSQAAYTSTGQLMCSACRCPVKSTAQWESHLQSEGHLAVVQRIKQSRHTTPDVETGDRKRKRKGDTDEATSAKRSRNISSPPLDTSSLPASDPPTSPVPTSATSDGLPNRGINHRREQPRHDKSSLNPTDDGVNEEELAALERDMKLIEEEEHARRVEESTGAGPPSSAKDMAAKAVEEQSTQKDVAHQASKDEIDDAEEQTQDELARMEQLDEKIRGWRAKREAMAKSIQHSTIEQQGIAPLEKASVEDKSGEPTAVDLSDDEDDDDSEDEDDAWRGLGGL